MDGEVAQLAALAISANHRLACPQDPMEWFAGQRAFSSCGQIGFCATKRTRFGKAKHVPVANTPSSWLDLLGDSGVERVLVSCVRQDESGPEEDTLPDRLTAGFAGGGSLWTMATQSGNGGVLCWQAGWRAAFPRAKDGRIWQAEYYAHPCNGEMPQVSVQSASQTLAHVLQEAQTFAQLHEFSRVAGIFASALNLLEGRADTLNVPRPPGPADTLDAPARKLLFAGQRAWIFDNLDTWRDQDFSHDIWKRYADLSEALYSAVTAAIVAAVNSSALRT